jgi:PfaD family protein
MTIKTNLHSESVINILRNLQQPAGLREENGKIVISDDYPSELIGILPPMLPENLGDPGFKFHHNTRYAFYAGAMANGIASEELVIALGNAGMMGSFGAAGLNPSRVEKAIGKIQAALGTKPYAFNLINSPNEPALEKNSAALYLKHKVRTVEASAYVDLTVPLVHYRIAGLTELPDGTIRPDNKIIAKLSRREVARLFLSPPPEDIIAQLQSEGKISPRQADLARHMPVADDITVEADSGGHTDNRPLVAMMPGVFALRDELQTRFNFATPVRMGAAGGISTPEAALAAFMMGAAYIVTGSVNQSCLEAGTSNHTRKLLASASMADVTMAPSSDMFEMGVRVQVLKRGTMFPMRAQKLYELYSQFKSWEEVPLAERGKLEETVFKRDFVSVWQDTENFFRERDPRQLERAKQDPHYKMALVFRWYLGLSSRWSNIGEPGRELDYQIWCGPAMGAFNDWVRGTYLEAPENRKVVDVTRHILTGAAYLSRVRMLEAITGERFSSEIGRYQVKPF